MRDSGAALQTHYFSRSLACAHARKRGVVESATAPAQVLYFDLLRQHLFNIMHRLSHI